MTVGELMSVLARYQPEDLVICDTRSDALVVIAQRPGMHQVWTADEVLYLTAEDRKFLCALHIRDDRG